MEDLDPKTLAPKEGKLTRESIVNAIRADRARQAMKVYWDTSAIIWYFGRGRIGEIRGVTRPHTLSETFSALTGGGFELVMPDGTEKAPAALASRRVGRGFEVSSAIGIHRAFGQ